MTTGKRGVKSVKGVYKNVGVYSLMYYIIYKYNYIYSNIQVNNYSTFRLHIGLHFLQLLLQLATLNSTINQYH